MLAKIILSIFMVCVVSANESLLVTKVPGNVLGIKTTSKAWMSANFVSIKTYPMVSIKTNDLKANRLNFEGGSKNIQVKALYDGKNIAFLLKWRDSTKNIADRLSTDSFEDGFGIEMPDKLDVMPYVDFGDRKNGVIYFMAKAGLDLPLQSNDSVLFGQNETKQTDNAINVTEEGYRFFGFRTFRRINLQNSDTTMDLRYKNGYWLGSISKQIVDKFSNLNSGAFIVSFSIYDGQKAQRGRLRNLSAWIVVKLEGMDTGEQLAEKMNEKIAGDTTNGEKIALKNCSICHRYKQVTRAPKYMAPDLSFIGGYGNLEYLKESILNPNMVQVEDFTKTAHPNFSWSETNEEGKEISIMPSFDWMSKGKIDDLLAFLQTLK